MVLRHATTVQRLASIQRQGLLVSYAHAQAKIKAIWLHTPSRWKTAWAILHTQKRHKAALEDVVILEVSVSKKALKHFAKGIWYSPDDLAPEVIRQVIPASWFVGSVTD